MGMFDSMYDAKGNEWQTKAFERTLAAYQIGDELPADHHDSYQVEVLGGPWGEPSIDAYATIRDARLAEVPAPRDERLPLMDYGGYWAATTEGN